MSQKNPPQGGEKKTKTSALKSTSTSAGQDKRRAPLTLNMSVNVAGIHLKNPVLAASGTFGYGIEFEDIVSLDKLGGFVVKGLSREPMAGNPPPGSLKPLREC